jgi:threonyl-tRNA synthetase
MELPSNKIIFMLKPSDKNNPSIEIKRHSFAHTMAAAIKELFPKARFGVGPVIENGFYYDVELPHQLKLEDLVMIEKRMRDIIARKTPFVKRKLNLAEAKKIFTDLSEPYKLELIRDVENYGTTKYDEIQEGSGGEKKRKVNFVTIYKTGEFVDLCRGPHIKNTSFLNPKAFKLTKVAGAYWRGNEKNPMLQRIYGVAFGNEEEFKKYLFQQEEAKKRDHRKLGKDLNLFHIDDVVGLGLPLWHPKGAMLWRIIEDFWYKQHILNGYSLVRTPHIGNKILWETSGHWGFYNESMYPPFEVGQTLKENQEKKTAKESEQYLLKPMNCPFHIQIYKNKPHSYREFPLRWAECGTVYRFEKKGELSGLTRVRGFTQDDAHIICRSDQVEDELKKVIDFILFMFKSFGFNINNINVYLSVKDPKNTKYAGTEKGWKFAEKILEKVAKSKKLNYKKDIGGAVFYGPKLDFKIKDALDREWQCSTLQFDFNLPQRFQMSFTNNSGKEEQPYMLHRALFGSYERFIGLLIEHYAGNFPFWLAPVQVAIIPIGKDHIQYAQKIAKELEQNNIRIELKDENETIGKKIREVELQKIPYILVIGNEEIKKKTVTLRQRGEKETVVLKLNKAIEKFKNEQNPLA